MATVIRPGISERNKYWIDKHRHYELKHFCLQYPIWKREYDLFDDGLNASSFERRYSTNTPSDPTSNLALKRAYYSEKIGLIERAAIETDDVLYNYILKAVTEGLSYTYLRNTLRIPCSKDLYYDRYRRFFWLLSRLRG